MKYVSTRSAERKVDAAQAIVAGLSHEGGLYVPEEFPAIGADRIEKMANLPYAARAKEILGAYLTDYTEEELQQCVDGAYAPERFGGNPAPLEKVGGNLYRLREGSTAAEIDPRQTGTMVNQGYLEAANVDAVTEMVNMIEVHRSFEAHQKMMQSSDAVDRELNSKVGRAR